MIVVASSGCYPERSELTNRIYGVNPIRYCFYHKQIRILLHAVRFEVSPRTPSLSHAELNAIKKASKKLGDWRLEGCTMYVTLEPCQMCAGALMQSRIDRVVIGSMNPKAGCAGSVLNLLEMDGFNHKVEVIRGVLQEECSIMLSDFFRELREKKKMLKKSLAEQVGKSEN